MNGLTGKPALKRILLFFLTVYGMTMLVHGQEKAISLRSVKRDNPAEIPLHSYPWRFHAGDYATWARTDVDDANWDTVNTAFGNEAPLTGWDGFGWFRLWVKKDRQTHLSIWGLRMNHDGASEIYWDGHQIAGIGRVGHSKAAMKAERSPFLVIPLAVADTLPHLLAIRYSNYNHYFPDFIGFQAWIGDLQTMSTILNKNQEQNNSLLLSVAAQLTLILLHLFLFIFYPRQKLNLYYSLFVLTCAAALLAKYLYVDTSIPALQAFSDKLFFCSTVLITFTGGLLLYAVGYDRLPKWRLVALTGISAFFLITIIFFRGQCDCAGGHSLWTYSNIFFALVFLDGLWSITKAIRQQKPGVWLIAIGMLITCLLSIIVGSDVFGWFRGNYFVLIRTMAFATLVTPVFFSVYLALDFARTNRNLVLQLQQNKALAEGLEQTVLARTTQVREQADKLREMDAVKSRFFINLTHEFKTPLTLIMNPATELLQKENSAETRQHARLILRNSERLLQLTNQLLDLSKLESGQMEVSLAPMELVSWMRRHIQQYHSLAQQKEINLNFNTDTTSFWVDMDEDKLEKILYNLLSNAFKFTPTKGSVEVSLSGIRSGEAPCFEWTVKDTGIGIPAAKLPYIFDRFYQVDSSDTRSREGTGIGLALSKELVQLLRGSIQAESAEGLGTTFSVRIPCRITTPQQVNDFILAATAGNIPHPEEKAQTEQQEDEKSLVLIVEDNEDLRQFISLSLSDNYQIVSASNGEEGIQTGLEKIPTIIITDLMMPGVNGYEVCSTLKNDERTSHIPVIMLTAKADLDSRIQGIETGADAYLSKPFNKRELLALMENLISTRRQLRDHFGKNNNWLTAASTLPSMEKRFLDRVRKAVEAHLDDEHYNSGQLGSDVGLSRTQLHRKLKELINQSPGELIRSIRLQTAHDLLQNRIATVAEVAYMVGFSNPANFSTSFSRHFGYPPSETTQKSS